MRKKDAAQVGGKVGARGGPVMVRDPPVPSASLQLLVPDWPGGSSA
jgi:hypothetical protein